MVYFRKDYYRPIHSFQTLEENRNEENNRFPGSFRDGIIRCEHFFCAGQPAGSDSAVSWRMDQAYGRQLQCLYLTNSPESVTVRCKVEDGNLLIYHVFNNTEVVYQKLEN